MLSETANAERLLDLHGDRLRYHTDSKRWLVCEEGRWVEDRTGATMRIAIEAARATRGEAETFLARARGLELEARSDEARAERKRGQAVQAWATRSESLHCLRATLNIAADLMHDGRPVRVSDTDLNQAHDLLSVANGVVDLTTGRLMPHDPSHLFTLHSAVAYDARANCPMFLRFLEQVSCGDADWVGWLQRLLGYMSTGRVSTHILPIFTGDGGNGKGVLFRVLERILGDFSITTPITTLMAVDRNGDSPRADVARFVGRRLVLASEGAQDKRLDEALSKMLTGGDTVTARFLYGQLFQFAPTHKLAIATNYPPKISGTDEGIWRRVTIVPFRARFGGPGQAPMDSTLDSKLAGELPGILRWMVEGAVAWYRDGLGTAASIEKATTMYRGEQDRVGVWLSERCVKGAEHTELCTSLYRSYERWCEESAIEPLTQNGFARELGKKGYGTANSRVEGGTMARQRTGLMLRA